MVAPTAYTAESIQVLQGWEAVRKRPGMYFGDLEGGRAMHEMLWEVIGNAVDECLDSDAIALRVDFDGTRATVEDAGRGIPIDAIERVMTQLHAGTNHRRPHTHLRYLMHGVGVAAASALCSELRVDVWRDGWHHVQRFARGQALGPVEQRERSARTGTRVSFVPDFTILPHAAWNIAEITRRCRELAVLIPTLAVAVDGTTMRYSGGAVEYIEELADGPVIDPMLAREVRNGLEIEVVLAWKRDRGSLHGFVNYHATVEGTHVIGLHEGLRRVFVKRIPRFRRVRGESVRKRIAPHLIAFVNVMLDDPRFGSPSRTWLTNPEVRDAVASLVERELVLHFERAPAMLDTILLEN